MTKIESDQTATIRYFAEAAMPVDKRQEKRALEKIDLVLRAALSPAEKIVLLALARREPASGADVTAGAIAAATGLHRVTVQRTLTAMRKRHLLSGLEILWDVVETQSLALTQNAALADE